MAKLKLQALESYLQDIDGFTKPKIELEQYETTPHLAACMLYTIESSFGDIDGKVVADLGCGSGRLLAGLLMLGASYVVGVDADSDALDLCQRNIAELNGEEEEEEEEENVKVESSLPVDLIQADVCTMSTTNKRLDGFFDCIVMNPPFGTKENAGIDVEFVKQGLRLTNGSVYSLHKSSTREHLVKVGESWGVTVEVLAEMKFDLPKSYNFHKMESKDIQVDLIRFTRVANKPLTFNASDESATNNEIANMLAKNLAKTLKILAEAPVSKSKGQNKYNQTKHIKNSKKKGKSKR